ncbi:nucleotidyltransferase substrate binding like family protein [Rickettsia hoogstraalii str. RCCE3]|nr:nucleotidyltransferase substrate binding like family protein [Rickettsia hoogstraalii str. RCCE3]
MEEIFWKDSFLALGQAIQRLHEVIERSKVDKNDYVLDASVKRFEFVIELFWKTLKKYLNTKRLKVILQKMS